MLIQFVHDEQHNIFKDTRTDGSSTLKSFLSLSKTGYIFVIKVNKLFIVF